MRKKFTHEEVEKIIFTLSDGNYILMPEPQYINTTKSIHIKHLKCGTIMNTTLKLFKKTNGCCNLCDKKGYTHDIIKKLIAEKTNNEYELTDKVIYKNSHSYIYVKHNKCGKVFKTKWDYIKENCENNNVSCSHCNRKNTSFEKMSKKISEFNNKEFVLTKDLPILGTNKPIIVLDTKCNQKFETTYNRMKQNHLQNAESCTHCQIKHYNNDIISKELKKFTNDEYVLSKKRDYVNSHTPFWLRHTECNHEFPIIWDNKRKQLQLGVCICPKCKKYTIGEEIIKNYLEQHKTKYIPQYSHDDCRSNIGFLLSYDFMLPDENIFIEFDGPQHFKSIDSWDGEDGFEKRQSNDLIKNNYCKNNNHLLLRIPYNEMKNIIHILEAFFNSKNKKQFLIKYYNIFEKYYNIYDIMDNKTNILR